MVTKYNLIVKYLFSSYGYHSCSPFTSTWQFLLKNPQLFMSFRSRVYHLFKPPWKLLKLISSEMCLEVFELMTNLLIIWINLHLYPEFTMSYILCLMNCKKEIHRSCIIDVDFYYLLQKFCRKQLLQNNKKPFLRSY